MFHECSTVSGHQAALPKEASPNGHIEVWLCGELSLFFVALFLGSSGAVYAKKPNPKSCVLGEHWVRAHHRRAYSRADGTPVSSANVDAHCQKNPAGYDYWSQRIRTGFPPDWSHPEEKAKPWTDEEKERVLEALSELPELIWVSTIEGIYRLGRSRFFPNPAGGEPRSIALYDEVFTQKKKLSQVLAHELAHELFRNLSTEERKSYLKANFWYELRKDGKVTSTIRGRSERFFVAIDGTDSPDEDFSNNLEYLFFEPGTLERVTPQAFKWFKEHYGDKMKLRPGRK